MLYLTDQNGEPAPSLWVSEENSSNDNLDDIHKKIEEANDELISTSIDQAKCKKHRLVNFPGCKDCKTLEDFVTKFQTHRCSFTCKKKGKFIKLLGNQGLGIHETDRATEIVTHICRFRFPRFPMECTKFLKPISKTEDPKQVNKMKKDLQHIKAYLIRKTYFLESNEDEESWLRFKNMNFFEFLEDVGMFENLGHVTDPEERQLLAKARYLNALRADISGNGHVYHKRQTKDVYINNYNRILMPLLQSNHDIQYVFDEFACTNYITAYITKNESGTSKLLKTIDEEKVNLTHMEKVDKFAQTLDRGREISIQESIYRSLGLPMSKFSTKVKYISTSHPHNRDGLLRADIENLEVTDPVFHLSPHQYYEYRPIDNDWDIDFESMCLADFHANFEIRKVNSETSIPLLNNSGYITRRKKPAVLRYYLNFNEPEDLARGLLILFVPFRSEMDEIHDQNVHDLVHESRDLIEENRKFYEKGINLTQLIEEIEAINEERDEEEEEDNLIDDDFEAGEYDETTSEREIQQFISEIKSSAKKDIRSNSDNTIPDINDIVEKIILLNHDQRTIFDDVCERISSNEVSKEQFCLYIAGFAGTGKTFLLRLLIDAVRYLEMQSGDEIEKCKVLVMAPTANSAMLINGKTIESALSIAPQSRWNYTLTSQDRQTKFKFLYEDLKVVFLDEVSMCGSNKLAKINYQLQQFTDGPAKLEFCGSKTFITGGDLQQLPAVLDQMIFEKSTLDRRPACAISHWDDHFRIYYLTQKMRCIGDLEFNLICDRG